MSQGREKMKINKIKELMTKSETRKHDLKAALNRKNNI